MEEIGYLLCTIFKIHKPDGVLTVYHKSGVTCNCSRCGAVLTFKNGKWSE